MKLSIGENIKSLRTKRNITQEALAEMLGISCQSVSRWELGVCYPDMELMPEIARIFDISVDRLMGVDTLIEKKKVDEYLKRFQGAINHGKIDECIFIAREGVAEFPNNYELLNKLMYALFVSGDESGNIPDWKENMEKYDKEIVALGERIMKYCPDQNLRLEATSRLAFQHCEMGRRDIGRQIYESLPPQWLCRENHIWWGLEEEEKRSFLQGKIRYNFGQLRHSIWKLALLKDCVPEQAVLMMEKIYTLDELICDGEYIGSSFSIARYHVDSAGSYARMGDLKKACEHLCIAAEAACSFDERPETVVQESLLIGKVTLHRAEFDTADSRPLCQIMAESWLADAVFDKLRDTAEFRSILEMLQDGVTL